MLESTNARGPMFRALISDRAERLELTEVPRLHSLYGSEFGILNPMHVSQRFERLLDAHRRTDGSRWTGQQLDEATGGVVTRSYITNLRKGRIQSPGYEKMAAI